MKRRDIWRSALELLASSDQAFPLRELAAKSVFRCAGNADDIRVAVNTLRNQLPRLDMTRPGLLKRHGKCRGGWTVSWQWIGPPIEQWPEGGYPYPCKER